MLVVLIVSVVLVVLVVVVVVDHQVCGAWWCMSGGWDGVPVIRGVSRGV